MTSQAFTTKKKKTKKNRVEQNCSNKIIIQITKLFQEIPRKRMIDIGMWIGMWHVGKG